MTNPSITNVDGTNTGPNVTTLPDTIQMPTGNIWKNGVFSLTLSPASVAVTTTTEQTFAATGIGLIVGDLVVVNKPSSQAGLAIGGARVSAADTLAITYINVSASAITPTQAEVYIVGVFRDQPNWTPPATGNQLDW
ncbi:MAG TPA: hypothetical protein VMS08_06290 [Candidatus Saccharimonadia bacterium]|nr:hypothetical protein [Candidatus Saccharimonadia bacterium]